MISDPVLLHRALVQFSPLRPHDRHNGPLAHRTKQGLARTHRAIQDDVPYANLSSSRPAPEAPAPYIYDQRNAQKAPLARRVKGKIVLVLEGVMFAAGLLMVAVPSYIMFIERGREVSRS
jgi:hypothetical protein